ncbi:hypothetical protein D9M68_862190 [compost metagenome]
MPAGTESGMKVDPTDTPRGSTFGSQNLPDGPIAPRRLVAAEEHATRRPVLPLKNRLSIGLDTVPPDPRF